MRPAGVGRVVVDSGREVSWMLAWLSLPGAEQLMPVMFPKLVAEGGKPVSVDFLYSGGTGAPQIAEMWRADIPRGGRESQGVRTDDARRDRTGRTDGQRARPHPPRRRTYRR